MFLLELEVTVIHQKLLLCKTLRSPINSFVIIPNIILYYFHLLNIYENPQHYQHQTSQSTEKSCTYPFVSSYFASNNQLKNLLKHFLNKVDMQLIDTH